MSLFYLYFSTAALAKMEEPNAPSELSGAAHEWRRKLSPAEKRGLEILRKKCTQVVGGLREFPTDDPSLAFREHGYKGKYKKPSNQTICINRDHFPLGKREQDWERILTGHCSSEEQRDVRSLFEAFKQSVSISINSKLCLHFTEAAYRSRMLRNGGNTRNIKEVFLSWTKEQVDETKCRQLYYILHQSVNDRDMMARLEFDILNDHGFYFTNGNREHNCKSSGRGVLKRSSICQLIKAKIRNNYRNRFTTNKVPHRVTVTVAVRPGKDGQDSTAGIGEEKRSFDMVRNVRGFNSQPHLLHSQNILAAQRTEQENLLAVGTAANTVPTLPIITVPVACSQMPPVHQAHMAMPPSQEVSGHRSQ